MPKPTPLPLWLFADGLDGTRNFLIRTEAPRFIAEVFAEDDDAGILAELSFALSDGRSLANFTWLDPQPEDYLPLLRQADNALRDYDDMVDLEMTEDEDQL